MNMIENLLNNFKNNNIEKNKENSLSDRQNNFLKTNFGQVINNAIDFGIKAVLPNWLENEIIEIKDTVFNEGFKEGVEMAIEKAIDLGKSLEGIFTGNFENISQIETVIKSGGLLDTISDLLDNVIKWAKDKKIISNSTAKLIKASKKTIMENIENNIDNSLQSQVTSIEKIDGYIDKWNSYYNEQDFTNMKKIYNKIQKEMEKIVPLQDVLNKVESLTNIQELLENNGRDFDLSKEELELSSMLVY